LNFLVLFMLYSIWLLLFLKIQLDFGILCSTDTLLVAYSCGRTRLSAWQWANTRFFAGSGIWNCLAFMYFLLEIRGDWSKMPIQEKKIASFSLFWYTHMLTSLTDKLLYFLVCGKWNVIVSYAFLAELMGICSSSAMLLKFYIVFIFYTLPPQYWWDSIKDSMNLNNRKQLQISEMWDSIHVIRVLVLRNALEWTKQRLQIV